MQCSACGAQNPDEAYFCGSCGAQMRSAIERGEGPVTLDPSAGSGSSNRIDLAAIGRSALEAEEKAEQAARDPLAPPADPPALASTPGPYVAPPPGQSPSSAAAGPPPNPYQPSAGIYQPPPGQYPQSGQYPAPGPYQVPGQALPPAPGGPSTNYPYVPYDGNTSGMGPGYPMPPEAEGWTFGGFVPFGLFGFLNGNTTWGVLGLVGSFIGILNLVAAIYVGVKGREMAWQGRRFDSVQQFVDTMRAWSMWGLFVLIASAVGVLLYIVFVIVVAFAGIAASGTTP